MGSAPIPSTITGTVLVSSTDIDGILWGPGDLNPYATFRDRKPDDAIANIIFVYHGTFNLPLLAAETNASTATALLRQGRLPEALTFAQTATQQAPDSADVNAILGQVLLASGQVPAGQQALANALHLAQTNHPEYQQNLISFLQRPPTRP
jgi:thioredoxin-like negative regulator of GroEL